MPDETLDSGGGGAAGGVVPVLKISPKKGMSAEHKAAMAAGRERTRLAKVAKAARLEQKAEDKANRASTEKFFSEQVEKSPYKHGESVAVVMPPLPVLDPAAAYRAELERKVDFYQSGRLQPDQLGPYLEANPEIEWYLAAKKKADLAARKAEFDRMMGVAPESVVPVQPALPPVTRDDRGMPVGDPHRVRQGNNPVTRILAQLTYPADKEGQVVAMIAANMAPSVDMADPTGSEFPPLQERAVLEHMREYCLGLRPELPKTRLEPKYQLRHSGVDAGGVAAH